MNLKYVSMALAAIVLFPGIALAELRPLANQKGKFGYTDESGAYVIQPQYDDAQPFFQGKAIVRKGNNFGLINEQNQLVLPIKYNVISPVDDNTFMVAVDGKIRDGHLYEEKYGFVTSSGEVIIKPEYIEMSPFNQFGLALIRHKNGKCGFIDTNYRFVVPVEFDFSGSFNDKGVTWLNKGGRPDNDGDIAGGTFFVINTQGNMFLPGQHASIGYFRMNNWKPTKQWLETLAPTYQRLWRDGNSAYYNWSKYYFDTKPGSRIPEDVVGYWASPTKEGYGNGVYDTSGNLLIEPGKFYSALMPEKGIAVVCPKKDKYNYFNINTGQFVLTKDIERAYALQDGFGVCTAGKKMFIVDGNGAACSEGYDVIYPYADGMHIVTTDGYFGIIGHDGHQIIPCSAPDIWPIKDGRAIVKVGTKFAYAGETGFVTEAIFNRANNFLSGYTWADDGNGWHLYNTSFKKITKKPVESGGYNIHTGLYWAKDKETKTCRYYNILDGSEAFSGEFAEAENFGAVHEGVARVSASGKDNWGIIDLSGNQIIPCTFNKDLVFLAYQQYLDNDRRPWKSEDTFIFNVRNNPMRHKYNLTQRIDNSFWDF